jgi:hypothetical protein
VDKFFTAPFKRDLFEALPSTAVSARQYRATDVSRNRMTRVRNYGKLARINDPSGARAAIAIPISRYYPTVCVPARARYADISARIRVASSDFARARARALYARIAEGHARKGSIQC